MPPPRIAFFPDSFHELNGVAHTSRNFAAYAGRNGIPMLCVCAGAKTQRLPAVGSVETLELGRSPLAVSLERDLTFDPLFFRYSNLISDTIRSFAPAVIHITGPSELGLFGAYFAHKLRIPLVASWHTNVHEYAMRRLGWLTRHLYTALGQTIEAGAGRFTLAAITRFYSLARVLYAPNPGLCALLQQRTRRPCHLMQRGVDTALFRPERRTRPAVARDVLLGFVGRLSIEKNVALLPRIDRALRACGIHARWLIAGHGSEEAGLRRELGDRAIAGVLRGEDLAVAYANMDLFLFPSHTDTFGNVVLEAFASGTPAVVTPDGGPAHIVEDGVTGRIVPDEEFALAIADLLANPERLTAMRAAARAHALTFSWDAVFDGVLAAYPPV